MKPLDKFYEYLGDREAGGARWPSAVFAIWSVCACLRYRLSVRSVCAVKGCHILSSNGGYLPDDCYEWWCKRCGAEGINHLVYGLNKFYNDDPWRNLWETLRGR
jgi:hypothetical protein